MLTFIAATGVLLVGFLLFAAAIHFSRYRQTEGRCCTAGLGDMEEDFDCNTCPNKDKEECALHEDEQAELLEIK